MIARQRVVQDGRIHIEKINGPMLFKEGASPAEYWAGLQYAINKGWLRDIFAATKPSRPSSQTSRV